MKIVVTGHRPDKLIGGWDSYNIYDIDQSIGDKYDKFIRFLVYYFDGLGVTHVNLGCASGFDTLVAIACKQTNSIYFDYSNLTYTAFMPFNGFNSKSNHIKEVLKHADKVITPPIKPVEKYEIIKALDQRNKDMIDDEGVEAVISLWNGSNSGTKNALAYAKKKGIPIINIWNEYELIFK